MARLLSTGFELQSVAGYVEIFSTGGDGGELSISTNTKKSGNAACRFYNITAKTNYAYHIFSAYSNLVFYARFYLFIHTIPSANTSIAEFAQAYTHFTCCGLRLNADQTLELYFLNSVGEIVVLNSASSSLALDTWYMIEMKVDATGNPNMSFEARLNGLVFASGSGTTGLDASSVGNFYFGIDAGAWAGTNGLNAASADLYFDDIAINSSDGVAQTGYPGEGSIVHLHPNGAGDSAATTGTYADIDEVPPDDITSYIEIDTNISANYTMTSSLSAGIGENDTITLVQVGTRQRPETAASVSWTPQIKSESGGIIVTGDWDSNQDNISFYSLIGNQSPWIYDLTSYEDPEGTGVWTPTLIDTMIVGVIVADADPDLWFTNIWALVEYIPEKKYGAFLLNMI